MNPEAVPTLSAERDYDKERNSRAYQKIGEGVLSAHAEHPYSGSEVADLTEGQLEFLEEVARKAASEAPTGLEKKRAVDAVMAVLVNWQVIDSDLENADPAHL